MLVQQQLDVIDDTEAKLEVEYGEVQDTERKLVADLNEKYGPGNLDPATGVFTPAPVDEAAEETSETT